MSCRKLKLTPEGARKEEIEAWDILPNFADVKWDGNDDIIGEWAKDRYIDIRNICESRINIENNSSEVRLLVRF